MVQVFQGPLLVDGNGDMCVDDVENSNVALRIVAEKAVFNFLKKSKIYWFETRRREINNDN